MIRFRQFIAEQTNKPLSKYPKEKVRTELTDSEKPWEWREYHKFARDEFPKAFDSEKHFWKKYDQAPLVHLKDHEIANMGYSTAGASKFHQGEAAFHADPYLASRRDTHRIAKGIKEGGMPAIIVLKHSKGHRILGGNTRLNGFVSTGHNPPVKLIDISDRH